MLVEAVAVSVVDSGELVEELASVPASLLLLLLEAVLVESCPLSLEEEPGLGLAPRGGLVVAAAAPVGVVESTVGLPAPIMTGELAVVLSSSRSPPFPLKLLPWIDMCSVHDLGR